MSELVEIAKINELQEGSMKAITVGGHSILLACTGTAYYATDVRCPHMGGNLAKGKLEGTIVTCPLHGSQFDLANGQVVRWLKKSGPVEIISKLIKHERPLTTYKIKIEGESILIEL